MTDESTIRGVVDSYLALVAGGSAADIVALYAETATVEDPVGSDVLVGHEAIEKFYAGIEGLDQTGTLLMCRVLGNEALFGFELVTSVGESTYTLTAYDHMRFDDAGKITAMRAFWGASDLVVS